MVNGGTLTPVTGTKDLVITVKQAKQIGLNLPMVSGLDAAPPFATLVGDPEAANNIYFANANLASAELIDPAIKSDPDVYPPQAVRSKLFSEQLQSLREQRERTRLWTTFRTQL